MAPTTEEEALAVLPPMPAKETRIGHVSNKDLDEWVQDVDDVSAQIKGIIEGTITDFDAFDHQYEIKKRAKQIREEEQMAKRNKFFLYGREGKGEGDRYKWWCKRCFVEYLIDLPNDTCTRCRQSDKMMTQEQRREELMGKLEDYKKTRASHQWRKDKWLRWKKSQALLGRSRNINYKAWEYWEPDTETEDEGDPIVPKDNPEFLAMEADIKERHRKADEKAKTAERCRERGNQCMKDGDFVGAIEHYDEGLEYKRDNKSLWTNKALAELKVFRWHDAIASCNKVIEYSEIFEDGFNKSADACFKAFMRRAAALRALHRWAEAVEDLQDALKIFPKDKDAKDLLEKTQLALQESKKAEEIGDEAPIKEAPKPDTTVEIEEVPEGPVRVEIEEESSDEEEEVPKAAGRANSALAAMSRKEFQALESSLKKEPERVRFCARKGSANPLSKKEDTRKVDLKQIEEVQEPSKLDEVIKDAERAAILWKKVQGNVVPLREGVKHLDKDAVKEDKESRQFLDVIVPRILSIFHVLASTSDHHCALTAPAVRHVWPLITKPEWRQQVLELLMEWSQRTISARTMAEFASRYADPYLAGLVEIVSDERKENMLPPGFESRAKQASERLSKATSNQGSLSGMDAAFEEVLSGLQQSCPAELVMSILGNLCLCGGSLVAFKEQMGKYAKDFVSALGRELNKPMNWRFRGRAAGAVCNLLRLGDTFGELVESKCTKALVSALKEEIGESSGAASQGDAGTTAMLQALRSGLLPGGSLPGVESAVTKLLSALTNLVTVRPGCSQELVALGLLDSAITLMDPKAQTTKTAVASGDKLEDVVAQGRTVVARLLAKQPDALSVQKEAQLLKLLTSYLVGSSKAVRAKAMGAATEEENRQVETLELAVRTLAVIMTKTTGGLDRLIHRTPKVMEVDETTPVGRSQGCIGHEDISFKEITDRLLEISLAARPHSHVAPDEVGNALSRLRGNLAVLLGALCEGQTGDSVPPALRDLDLAPIVETFVECLRKERGPVQNNIGVFVTKLAQNPTYKNDVRDANGMESLHQIQLPRVEAQKAAAQRMHRIETNSDARRAEIARRLEKKS
mmetsp:Transcript_13849/g.30537  ORF Transcript_13849/g.30537 Transcript_13849/m.30537 type:complete len:1088 (-) Transcript_13849:137-3400(-)